MHVWYQPMVSRSSAEIFHITIASILSTNPTLYLYLYIIINMEMSAIPMCIHSKTYNLSEEYFETWAGWNLFYYSTLYRSLCNKSIAIVWPQTKLNNNKMKEETRTRSVPERLFVGFFMRSDLRAIFYVHRANCGHSKTVFHHNGLTITVTGYGYTVCTINCYATGHSRFIQ